MCRNEIRNFKSTFLDVPKFVKGKSQIFFSGNSITYKLKKKDISNLYLTFLEGKKRRIMFISEEWHRGLKKLNFFILVLTFIFIIFNIYSRLHFTND